MVTKHTDYFSIRWPWGPSQSPRSPRSPLPEMEEDKSTEKNSKLPYLIKRNEGQNRLPILDLKKSH